MYVDVDVETYVRRDLDLYAHARVRVASAGMRSLRYDMMLERFGFGRRTAAGDTPGARGGHSHTRNTIGRDRGHKVVTKTLAIFLVVTGSQDISGNGHGSPEYFWERSANEAILATLFILWLCTPIAMQAKSMYV